MKAYTCASRLAKSLALIVVLAVGLTGLLSSSPVPALAQGALVPLLTKVGNPIWKPVDFHLFSTQIGTPPTFSALFSTLRAILPSPNHELHPALFIGPGDPHCGPYDTELAQGMAALGLVDSTEYGPGDFTDENGIVLMFMTVADPGRNGTSPDTGCGQKPADDPRIIPNRLFPNVSTVEILQNGKVVDMGELVVPPLDNQLDPPFDVDGHSHFPSFHIDSKVIIELVGGHISSPRGNWEYRVTMKDQAGNGWVISAPFTIQ
jgi:hypothetical protein